MTRLLWIATASTGLALATACEGTLFDETGFDGLCDTWETGCGGSNDPPVINGIDWNCSAATGEWTYDAELTNYAGSMVLSIVETGDPSDNRWTEEHDLQNVGYDEETGADFWGLTLGQVATPGGVISNQTTLFQCGTHGDDSLAWKMVVFDEGNQRTDCAVWGYQVEVAYAGDNCINWNQ